MTTKHAEDLGPALSLWHRWRHRVFVARRHRLDVKTRGKTGLSSFPDDWRRLAVRSSAWPDALPRRMFLLWLQGEERAPDLVRHCVESWRRHHPGWTVEVLNEDEALERTGLSGMTEELSPNHRANIIRLRLLAREGGVWADATSLCMRPLDDWLGRAAAQGFFCFSRPQPVRSLANWFIASAPGEPLTEAWRRWSEAYAFSSRPVATYFWSHHTFDWLLTQSPALKARWKEVPKISARGPHVLQRLLDGHLGKEDLPSAAQMAQIPLFKLSWKKGYDIGDIDAALARYGLCAHPSEGAPAGASPR